MTAIGDLRAPRRSRILGRSSTLTAAFANAVLPSRDPTLEEKIDTANRLGLNIQNVECAYCGDRATEWDHFRPIVSDKRPTGWTTEPANLVPACGKCNQSKGKRNWEVWMLGPAKGSPTTRKIADTQNRIERLKEFEKAYTPNKIDLSEMDTVVAWGIYWKLCEDIVKKLEDADRIADSIRGALEDRLKA